MTEYAECIGGPLDGRRAAVDVAFPWPHGWYYLRRLRADGRPQDATETLRGVSASGPFVFVWQGEPGWYTPTDAERHAAAPHPVR